MSYYAINLKAGIVYRQDTPGTLILVDSTGASGAVDITLLNNGTPGTTMPARKTAFRYIAAYDGVLLQSAVDTTVGIFLSFNDVQLGMADGAAVAVPNGLVVTNPPANPVNVNFAGTVAPVIGTLNNTNAQAVPVQRQALSTITDLAPVSVGVAATALISDATQKRLRIRNSHATAKVGIGSAGVTLANAAILLNPGDVWTEEDAAGAAWYAISDTAATSVQLQGLK